MNATHSHRADQPGPDGRQVEQMARDAIDAHARFYHRGDRFEFTYHEGVLEVRGTADSFYLKQVLQTVLQGLLKGVCGIDNQVTVVSKHHSRGDKAGRDAAQQ